MMRIEYSEITVPNRYDISCKTYLPDTDSINAVILGVHGFAGDKESSMLEVLAQRGEKSGTALITFDFPAHGDSPVGAERLTVRNCINDLKFMAQICHERWPQAKRMIFATSFGGFITLCCSEDLKDFDIVLRAPALTMPEHILLDILKMTPEAFRGSSPVETGYDRKILLPYAFYEDLQEHKVMNKDFRGKEMLIIHGDSDNIVPPEDIRRFCELHPEVRLEIIPGADHRFKNPGEMDKVVEKAFRFWDR